MEWWLWLIIIGSILIVGIILFMLLSGGDEEEAAEAVEEVEITNLDKALAGLEKDGLEMTVGQNIYLQISDDGAKGFAWAINEAGCADVVEVKVLKEKPGAAPAAKEEEAPAKEEKAEEKDEKKLRDGHEKDEKKDEKADAKADEKKELPVTYMEATAVGEGKCTFQMAWSDDAKAIDWEEEKTWPEKVVAFDITVAAKEGESKEAKKEEPKKEEKKE